MPFIVPPYNQDFNILWTKPVISPTKFCGFKLSDGTMKGIVPYKDTTKYYFSKVIVHLYYNESSMDIYINGFTRRERLSI